MAQPSDWNLESGWEIAELEGGHALGGHGHVWAFLEADPWYDYRYTFRLKLEPGAALHANIRIMSPSRYFIGLNTTILLHCQANGADQFFHDLSRGGYFLGLAYGRDLCSARRDDCSG